MLTNMCMITDSETDLVLVQQRKKSWQGLTFPGGKLEPKESILDSVVREVKEETGLQVSNLKLCGIKDWYEEENDFRYVVFLYQTADYQGELLEETEEGTLKWMELDELTEENCSPGFAVTLEVFKDPAKQEHFYYYDSAANVLRNQVI
ncbi:8-oxo-dGTP diphosphatase [Desemzia sp. RIT804]|nr:8-oxo-dGTP diphosphatase [Desemzia sp. RIT 804]MBM6616016.1 8-oxo-dGTP diphosphatase [Desemzia sp. RIT 804]